MTAFLELEGGKLANVRAFSSFSNTGLSKIRRSSIQAPDQPCRYPLVAFDEVAVKLWLRPDRPRGHLWPQWPMSAVALGTDSVTPQGHTTAHGPPRRDSAPLQAMTWWTLAAGAGKAGIIPPMRNKVRADSLGIHPRYRPKGTWSGTSRGCATAATLSDTRWASTEGRAA
jgi:hypothetical protein